MSTIRYTLKTSSAPRHRTYQAQTTVVWWNRQILVRRCSSRPPNPILSLRLHYRLCHERRAIIPWKTKSSPNGAHAVIILELICPWNGRIFSKIYFVRNGNNGTSRPLHPCVLSSTMLCALYTSLHWKLFSGPGTPEFLLHGPFPHLVHYEKNARTNHPCSTLLRSVVIGKLCA